MAVAARAALRNRVWRIYSQLCKVFKARWRIACSLYLHLIEHQHCRSILYSYRTILRVNWSRIRSNLEEICHRPSYIYQCECCCESSRRRQQKETSGPLISSWFQCNFLRHSKAVTNAVKAFDFHCGEVWYPSLSCLLFALTVFVPGYCELCQYHFVRLPKVDCFPLLLSYYEKFQIQFSSNILALDNIWKFLSSPMKLVLKFSPSLLVCLFWACCGASHQG